MRSGGSEHQIIRGRALQMLWRVWDWNQQTASVSLTNPIPTLTMAKKEIHYLHFDPSPRKCYKIKDRREKLLPLAFSVAKFHFGLNKWQWITPVQAAPHYIYMLPLTDRLLPSSPRRMTQWLAIAPLSPPGHSLASASEVRPEYSFLFVNIRDWFIPLAYLHLRKEVTWGWRKLCEDWWFVPFTKLKWTVWVGRVSRLRGQKWI
jgi:hypothetical protein